MYGLLRRVDAALRRYGVATAAPAASGGDDWPLKIVLAVLAFVLLMAVIPCLMDVRSVLLVIGGGLLGILLWELMRGEED